MKKIYFLFLSVSIFIGTLCAQNDITVRGKVMDDQGIPLIGANVQIEGETVGTVTDFDGNFELRAEPTDVLVISYVGYDSQRIPLDGRSSVEITMRAGQSLDEVVVTALGITREKKALGYAVQEIEGESLRETTKPNVIEALQGKLSGVLINTSSGAPGAGSQMVIRGLNSIDPTRDNSPLFVIDGIPVSNRTTVGSALPSTGTNAVNSEEQVSLTNRAADINPADIESVSILKGAAATALYGLRGANGVVVITTKKGVSGRPQVSLNTSIGVEELGKHPEYQTKYREGRFGRLRFLSNGDPNRFQSYGPKVYAGLTPVFDPLEDFFETGMRTSANLSVRGGTDAARFYSSLGYLNHEGIVPFSEFDRATFKVGGDFTISPKLDAEISLNYINSGGNKPHSGDKSIFSSLSYHPTSFDLNDYINPDGTQRDYSGGIIDNPRYLAEFSRYEDDVDRFIAAASIGYRPFDNFEISYRLGGDVYSDKRERIVPPGVDVSAQVNGFIIREDITYKEYTSTLMASYNIDIASDIDLVLRVGHDLNDQKFELLNVRGEDFTNRTFYDLSNTANFFTFQDDSRRRVVGVFGIASFAFYNNLYLEVTGRNDWSSTLPQDNRSFFYPSVSASFVLSDAWDLPSVFSYAKLRASYAEVAKDADPHGIGIVYVSKTNFPFNGVTGFGLDTRFGDLDLKPERTKGFEIGADFRFLRNRLGFDITYFDQTTEDLIVNVPISNTTGFARFLTNVGQVNNRGFELLLHGTPLRHGNGLGWDLNLNFTTSEGTIEEIDDDLTTVQFFEGDFGGITNQLVEGGSYGDLYGYRFRYTEDGQLLIDDDGFPIVNTDSLAKVGNAYPDWVAGFTNTFSYKNFYLSFLLEWRQGGDLYDMGLRNGIRNGVLEETVRRYEQVVFTGVDEEGNPNTTPVEITGESLYRSSTRYNRAAEVLLQDGSWFRMRRISLGYTLPSSWLEGSFIQRIGARFTVNNVFVNTPFRGYDPELSYFGAGSNVAGYTGLQTPLTRSYVLSLNFDF